MQCGGLGDRIAPPSGSLVMTSSNINCSLETMGTWSSWNSHFLFSQGSSQSLSKKVWLNERGGGMFEPLAG